MPWPSPCASLSIGRAHACVMIDDGSLKCWGLNSAGQLGYDHTNTLGNEKGEMVALGSVNHGAGRVAYAVSAGGAIDTRYCSGTCWYGHTASVTGDRTQHPPRCRPASLTTVFDPVTIHPPLCLVRDFGRWLAKVLGIRRRWSVGVRQHG